MNMKKVLFILVLAALLAAFGISAFMVGSYLLDGREQAKRNEELAQMVQQARPTEPVSQETVPGQETVPSDAPIAIRDPETGILNEYLGVHGLNNDMVGWLQIPNTELNYPVMQTPSDPNFYLDKDFDKEKSDRGAIYAWGSADVNEPSDNVTLFGHNMRDGSMFATLNNYENQYFWEDNSLILFNTLSEYHTYKIFAVFKTTATLGEGFSYHQFVDAEDEEAFDEFVKTCKDLSLYDTGITPVYGDKLIALSTCAYHAENGRLVVAAVRIT